MPSIRNRHNTAALAVLMFAALSPPLYAQDAGKANEGTGETPRGALAEFTLSDAKPLPVPKVSGEASRGSPFDDEKTLVDSLTAVGHNADGSVVKVGPDEALMGMIKAAAGTDRSAPAAGTARSATAGDKGDDPAFKQGEEADRQVFGADERVQIGNTQTFPFRAFGYIAIESKDGSGGSCSGTLIGPRTVLTAAHCIYNHEGGGWPKNLVFVPGVNGEADNPYGGFEYETAYVVQGFIENYKENYGSVTPWDLGVIVLKEPVGDSLGWLNYANYDDLGDFNVNIVGYPGDKPLATMWRTTCDVIAENIDTTFFTYDCDTYPGSSGSSVYAYDPGAKQRVVVGVNIAETTDYNLALRLNAGYAEWIANLRK